MRELVIVGAGITGLLSAFLYEGPVTVVDTEIEGTNSKNSLWSVVPALCGVLKTQCEKTMEFYLNLCEKFEVPCVTKEVVRIPPKGGKVLSPREVAELEEKLVGLEGEYLGKGLFIQGSELMEVLRGEIEGEFLRTRAIRIVREGDRALGIETEMGQVRADRLVLAVGYDPLGLLREFGVKVSSYKGHVVKVDRLGMRTILVLEDRIGVEGPEYALLNGDSMESTDPSVDDAQVERTLATFEKFLKVRPEVREVSVGFRAVSQDGMPLALRVLNNVGVATGFRFGWALAPYLAEQVLKLLGIPVRNSI